MEKGMDLVYVHIFLVTWLHTKYISETYLAFGPTDSIFLVCYRYAFGMCAIPLHTLYIPCT